MTDVSRIPTSAPYPESQGPGEPLAAYAPRDPFAELAVLLVENDFLRSELDDQSLENAREARARAMSDEIRAMHRAADAIVVQASVQGGMAALGGIAQCTGSLGQAGNTPPGEAADDAARCDYRRTELRLEGLGKAGGALTSMAEPAGALLGGTEKAHADADAAEAQNEAEQASFEASEAQAHRERVDKHTESLLDLVEGTLDSAHQGKLAILAKF